MIAPPLHAKKPEAFAFKSAQLNLVAFHPFTDDLEAIAQHLVEKLENDADFFRGEALVIDLIHTQAHRIDLLGLLKLMRQFHLLPVAIRHGNLEQQQIAAAHHLASLADERIPPDTAEVSRYEPTLVITRPVRTGQQIYAKNRDLVVLDLVSAGAELIADGSIHVYAPLRGRALAGFSGNTEAQIFTTCMEAELVSIAGVYRAIDEALPTSLRNKGARVFLDKRKLVIEALRF